ncbi:TolC family protein [Roseivirga sp. UBA838]|uniref:TolC family protein n=1 Tax=Roseivirga sp. UBA838 TaxID=1947393 RepID=UPI00257B7B90|nr:TolC family protein [Roseivirga sp. UBA838]|tara:strand:- start:67904 stop:69430 length:1527 start_codon:yes stop_codon:yes gene_type:complete
MKKVIYLLLSFFCLTGIALSQEVKVLTLEETIRLARENSRNAKQAETSRTLGYWSYQVYKSQLRPQLLLTGNLPNYVNRATPIVQEDGSVQYRTVNQNTSDLSLGLQQVLPWTNTTVSFETNLARFDNYALLGPNDPKTLYQGDPVGLTIRQPLFNVNPFKWDRLTQPLEYEQSKKSYVQDMEETSRIAAQFFFRLLVEQKNLEIAIQNEQSNDTIYRIEQGRYNIGTSTEDQLLQTELNLLTAQAEAQQARLDVQSFSLELRNFIGLRDDVRLELVPPSDVPEFSIDYEEALQYAKDNRAEWIEFQLQRLDAERQVADARARRFSADLIAQFGYNSAQVNSLSGVYDGANVATGSRVSLTFSLPILDGGRNKARMNQARARQANTEFTVEQNEINFEQEIANAVRNFDQIRSQIDIAEKRQEIALKGFEITNGRYLAGKVGILELNNARETKDAAVRNYISALQQYWVAYYELRSLTLYDFRNREILYNPLLEYDPKTDSVIEISRD